MNPWRGKEQCIEAEAGKLPRYLFSLTRPIILKREFDPLVKETEEKESGYFLQ